MSNALGVAGGADKQVQYNDGTGLSGIPNGTAGQVLVSAGAAAAPSFQTMTPGTAGGADKQLQVNNGGVLAGVSNGTAGFVLVSGGAGAAPSFQAKADAVTAATASGAIAISSGTVTLGSGGALAMTLATPASPDDDGKRIFIVAVTAQAHTVTTAANKVKNANASGDVLTFAHIGDSVELEAIGGLWYVRSLNGPVLTEV